MPDGSLIVTDRAILRDAAVKLQRSQDCEHHWMASILAWEAGELLRAAGLPDMAERCGDEWGCDVSDILAEVEWEMCRDF